MISHYIATKLYHTGKKSRANFKFSIFIATSDRVEELPRPLCGLDEITRYPYTRLVWPKRDRFSNCPHFSQLSSKMRGILGFPESLPVQTEGTTISANNCKVSPFDHYLWLNGSLLFRRNGTPLLFTARRIPFRLMKTWRFKGCREVQASWIKGFSLKQS